MRTCCIIIMLVCLMINSDAEFIVNDLIKCYCSIED